MDIRTYDDDPTKYRDLRVGRIDAILVDRLAALDLVEKPKVRWPSPVMRFRVRIPALRYVKSNEDLLKAVDTPLRCKKDGT